MRKRSLFFVFMLVTVTALAVTYTKYSYLNIVNSIMSSTAITASTINSTSIGITTPANALFTSMAASNIFGDSANINNFQVEGTAPFGHTLCGDGNWYRDAVNCGGDTPMQCNGNGCWYTRPDGWIVQFGQSGSCGGGSHACTVGVSFPTAFSTNGNLTVTITAANSNSNWLANMQGGPSTTGFTVGFGALVYNGGSGSTLSGSQVAQWIAIGH